MHPILTTENLAKSFLFKGEKKPILEGINFSIDSGRFVSIIGSSGCGKSTFLELLAGITFPDAGCIIYQNNDITGKSGCLGYMPQDDLLFPWLNVFDNAMLPLRVKNLDLEKGKRKIAELLPVFGLENHEKHLPHQLSGGLCQRVAFLRTYMTGSELLLLDEPFASLDAITRSQMQAWLKDITRELKLSVILVTHDIDEAIILSDSIHLMTGTPGSFTESFDLASITNALSLRDRIRESISAQLGFTPVSNLP
ncbi:MAG: ATP-binding cassette domain-containing protein [Candidatus Cloacimonadaceae bacterium]|nr:ATP-binding cassette domain-containing protein [Candidatus Cloacimonadaceae bacterium]MDP3114252.1 ATP-binding cassette domain-containing protein [Candidatus Cloacimonadaceae bacterium]